MKFLYTIILILSIQPNNKEQAINGMSFEGPAKEIKAEEFQELTNIHCNWVSLMPYAYAGRDEPNIYFENLQWQWWGEGFQGTKECIKASHKFGLKVMLKPHLWIRQGAFTGDVMFHSEEEWKIWEDSYEKYILKFAKLAEEEHVELFCIGTELKTFFLNRPDYWEVLIQKIKSVYKGKLTYAGNWDSYKLFPFWDEMDYIGVDAYFPLSEKKSPTIDELREGWKPWETELEKISERHNKPILFTEFGYRSIAYATHKPWESWSKHENDEGLQRKAYEALFTSVWQKEWLLGGFAWKWHASSQRKYGANTRYTPQNKPALQVIEKFYAR